ncbi:hypothetical protein AGMMS49975_13120 [Clostridia bacterium]|nr:hypothetical protein AGMMS49975_13120 [Clostridia bacterium]
MNKSRITIYAEVAAIFLIMILLSETIKLHSVYMVFVPYTITVGLIFAYTFFRKRNAASLGITRKNIFWQIIIGVILFVITATFTIILPLRTGSMSVSYLLDFYAKKTPTLVMLTVNCFIFSGFGEEIIFRGFIMGRLLELRECGSGRIETAALSVGLSAALFGIAHYPSNGDKSQLLIAIGIGILYGIVRLLIKQGSTLATGLAHGLHDTCFVFLANFHI